MLSLNAVHFIYTIPSSFYSSHVILSLIKVHRKQPYTIPVHSRHGIKTNIQVSFEKKDRTRKFQVSRHTISLIECSKPKIRL